jgi:peptidoglycan hydrolase-like protein with peptidoglycan-binding domain
MRTRDEQDATLRLTSSSPKRITAALAGIVTSTACVPGGQATSGAVAATVNDAAVVYLASSRPFWRDLSAGDSGDDVRALQEELRRLGYDVSADGRFAGRTLRAVTQLARAAGATDAGAWGMFPASRFVWIPAPSVTTVSCDVQVGDAIGPQTAIATLPRGLSAAAVTPLPEDVFPGARVILVGDVEIPVDASGAITRPDDLVLLSQSAAVLKFLAGENSSSAGSAPPADAQQGLPVSFRLAKEVSALSLPAAALYNQRGVEACVLVSGTPTSVTVVGSQLGQSYVLPQPGAVIRSVDLATEKAADCR